MSITICSTRGCDEIQRIAAAGIIDAVRGDLRDQPVVAGIVEAAPGQSRAELAALAGMVVDDVEDHLDAGGVQPADGDPHFVETAIGGKIARLRREKGERVIAPVIAQALLQQEAVLHEGVDRQQLDRR